LDQLAQLPYPWTFADDLLQPKVSLARARGRRFPGASGNARRNGRPRAAVSSAQTVWQGNQSRRLDRLDGQLGVA